MFLLLNVISALEGTLYDLFLHFYYLVGCFWFNGPLRQYFSLYRAVSQREEERKREMIDERKISKQPPLTPSESIVGPCPTIIQISRTSRH